MMMENCYWLTKDAYDHRPEPDLTNFNRIKQSIKSFDHSTIRQLLNWFIDNYCFWQTETEWCLAADVWAEIVKYLNEAGYDDPALNRLFVPKLRIESVSNPKQYVITVEITVFDGGQYDLLTTETAINRIKRIMESDLT